MCALKESMATYNLTKLWLTAVDHPIAAVDMMAAHLKCAWPCHPHIAPQVYGREVAMVT